MSRNGNISVEIIGVADAESAASTLSVPSPTFDTATHKYGASSISKMPQLSHTITPSYIDSDIERHQGIYPKYLLVISITIAWILCFIFEPFHDIGDLALWIVVFIHIFFQFTLFTTLFTAKRLRLFRSLTCKFSEFAPTEMPYGIKEYAWKPVTSISSLCAVRGSLLNKALSQTAVLSLVLCFLVFYQNIHKVDTIHGGWSGPILWFCSFIGFSLVGEFEFIPKHKILVSMHIIGAAMVGLGPIGLCILWEWSVLSIILLIGFWVAWSLWVALAAILPNRLDGQNATSKEVHRTSLICILFEDIGIFAAVSANWMFVYWLKHNIPHD